MPDTPTPAPALTDEQIDQGVSWLIDGRVMATDTAQRIIAAVIDRAKREERAEVIRWLGNLAEQIVGEAKASSALVWATEMLARKEATNVR